MTSLLLLLAHAAPAVLTVGPGKAYARIEAAYAAAQPGDTIEISADPTAYAGTAVLVRKARLRFVGVDAKVAIDGSGFNYSGAGSVPRAIFQIDPGADGVVIENLELRNAHNDSHNGAGVRINQARNATVRGCRIHANDMGIMSNGDGVSATSAENQLIESCAIYENGSLADPGYNHNLYLGGTSVTIQFCEIYGALTGHNLKSRAHFTRVQYNYIHDSANREMDLVDAWDTDRPNSNALLLGNVIVKKPDTQGNRVVIHFGQDGGRNHDGTIQLVNNTIVTPYVSPVVLLSSGVSRASFVNNVIFNPAQSQPSLAGLPSGGSPQSVSGDHNWMSRGYSLDGTAIDSSTRYQGATVDADPGFVKPSMRDYFLFASRARYAANQAPTFRDGDGTVQPASPQFQYKAPRAGTEIKWLAQMFVGAGVR